MNICDTFRSSTSFAVAVISSVGLSAQVLPVYDLEPVVVVAPNVWSPEAEFYRETFSSPKPVDLAAILSSQLPAAALTRKGPLAGDIVLRGFSRDNVVITVDDNKTFCACPNRMDPPAFHVSSQQIEGISIRKGPFSVDQGATIGGNIAVRTTAPDSDPFARAYGYYGSFDYLASGITAGAALNENASGLGGFYYQSGGVYEDGEGVRFTELPGSNYLPQYVDETAFEVYTIEVKGAYTLENGGSLTANYAFQDAQDVYYPGLRMDAPTDTMNRASVALRIPVELAMADDFQASLAFSHVDHDMRDTLRKSVNNMNGMFLQRGYFMRTEAKSTFFGGNLDFSKELDTEALIRYGLQIQRRQWDANNVIGTLRNDMLPDTITDQIGAWGVYERRSGSWAFETGFRLDLAGTEARDSIAFLQSLRQTDTNEQEDVLPSAYGLVSRDLTDDLNGFFGLGLASRLPDPQERYMNLKRPMMNPGWVGNPDLDPVQNLELQGGLNWHHGPLEARLEAFHAWLFNYVYLAELNSGMARATTYENIDARLYGVSFDAGWDVDEHFRIEGGLAWQEGIKESRPASATNDVLGEIPPLRARLAGLVNYSAWSAKAEGQFQDDLDRIDPDLNERPIDGWVVLNLSTAYQINENFSLSVGVDNVFDETYAVANAFVRDPFRSGVIVNEPGRFWFIRVGLEY